MRTRILLILVILLIALLWAFPTTQAQDSLLVTNPANLAQEAFSVNHCLYLPWFTPCQWRAFSLDGGEPWWMDCSALPCASLLPVSTNESSSALLYRVTLMPVQLTRNILTGETTLQPDGSTNVVAVIAAPNNYHPSTRTEDGWVLREWQQVTNCPSCWGLSAGEVPPPTVMLRALLADVNDYATYESNVEAEAEAAAKIESQAAAASASRRSAGGMFGPMDYSSSCTITNETDPFYVTGMAESTNNAWVTTTWQSCTDHVYIVQAESSLTPTSSWADAAWMWGIDQATSWVDTNAPSFPARFYRVVRANPNTLNNGIPYGWAVTYGLDPLDPNLAWEDPDGDGYDNWEEYQAGTDPRNPNSHPNSMLIIPNAWAVYVSSNSVQLTANVRSTNATVIVKAAEYFLDAITGTNGAGTAMSATNGTFNSTNETVVATFTPAFPYGERHVIYLHAEGSDGGWTPFKQVILNPNVNDILTKIQTNYSAFQDLQFNVTGIEYDNGVAVQTNTAVMEMKGPYKTWTSNDAGFVAIRSDNRIWWYNDALNIGGALSKGINGDFDDVVSNQVSDFFWDVPMAKTRTGTSISNSVNSASFNCQLTPVGGLLWPSQNFGVDYTKGLVTEMDGKTADVTMKSEYLNPAEILPGHWMFTFHRHTMTFDSGDTIVVESTYSNIVVNQGLPDSLFTIPDE
jgi:hypothetical protein